MRARFLAQASLLPGGGGGTAEAWQPESAMPICTLHEWLQVGVVRLVDAQFYEPDGACGNL